MPVFALVGLAGILAGCATARPPAAPTHYYVSWSGSHPPTGPLADQTDKRMRADPAFARDFADPINVRIRDGVPVGRAGMRFEVEMKTDPIMAGRRIREKDRVLARFSVTCTPDRWDPCVDRIVSRAHAQAARLPRLVARSPEATAANREDLQTGKVVGAAPAAKDAE